jgi:uncharacterized protein (TIGR02246 family)
MDDLHTHMQQRAGHPQFSRSCRVVPRSSVRVVVLALLVFSCGTPQPLPPRTFAMTDDQAIRGVLATQADAWNKGDLDGYMAGYAKTDELVFTSGGHVRRGWQETFDKYKTKYGGDHATMGHLTFELLAVQSLGPDGAIVLGRWKLTDTPNAGGGVFTVALSRTPAGWRIVHDHTSLDAP